MPVFVCTFASMVGTVQRVDDRKCVILQHCKLHTAQSSTKSTSNQHSSPTTSFLYASHKRGGGQQCTISHNKMVCPTSQMLTIEYAHRWHREMHFDVRQIMLLGTRRVKGRYALPKCALSAGPPLSVSIFNATRQVMTSNFITSTKCSNKTN